MNSVALHSLSYTLTYTHALAEEEDEKTDAQTHDDPAAIVTVGGG